MINYQNNMRRIFGILVMLILLICTVSAAQSFPEGFNGKIIIGDGSSSSGKTLIGYVNGVATGSATIKEDGSFDIVVVDNTGLGGRVEFKIGTVEAEEKRFTFEGFNIITTNLTFSKIDGINSCGNGVCGTGECSTCAIDCKVNDCVNNSVCDDEIGENCANSPEDCGVCLYCGDGTCNNGETCSSCSSDCGACSTSKKSSGGGGSSSSSTVKTSSSNATQSSVVSSDDNSELSDLSIGSLNEKDTKADSGLGITGNSILGFAKSSVGIGAIIIFVLVGLTLGVITIKKKNPKNENKVSP